MYVTVCDCGNINELKQWKFCTVNYARFSLFNFVALTFRFELEILRFDFRFGELYDMKSKLALSLIIIVIKTMMVEMKMETCRRLDDSGGHKKTA